MTPSVAGQGLPLLRDALWDDEDGAEVESLLCYLLAGCPRARERIPMGFSFRFYEIEIHSYLIEMRQGIIKWRLQIPQPKSFHGESTQISCLVSSIYFASEWSLLACAFQGVWSQIP